MTSLTAQMAYAMDPVAFAVDRLGITPDPWQADMLRSSRPTLVNCSRQSGKTTTVAVKATHQAVYEPGSLVLCIAPTQRQSAICAGKINKLIKALEPVEQLESDNKLSFTLANKSQIVALPGDPDTLRGYSAPQLIIIDEGAFTSNEMMEAIVPMLAVSEGRLLILSTPNGQRGFFYESWISPDDDWLRISVPATQCLRIKPAYLELMRKKMPPYKFRQEFFCEFTDSENQIFSSELVRSAITDDIAPLFTRAQLNLMGATWM
jgi:phage FluMu gp28-like protein